MSIAQIMTKSPFMFKIEHIVFLIMDSLAAFVISKFAQESSILDIYIVMHFFFISPLPLVSLCHFPNDH